MEKGIRIKNQTTEVLRLFKNITYIHDLGSRIFIWSELLSIPKWLKPLQLS